MVLSLTACDTEEAKPGQNGGAVKETSQVEKEGPWTVLVYLCGTDLESGQGSATSDLAEMMEKDTGDDCRFVVQTGGASKWYNEVVSEDKCERYEIQNKEMNRISSVEGQNMGDPKTLEEFVHWGVDNYGDGKLGLILWDHGGGSIQGVCMDENHDQDILTLEEIDQALSVTDRKFEFVGFDACLMSTLENAAMLSKHALYMIASEELESGYGWDYKSFTKQWKKNSSVSTPDLGKAICDGFMKSCEQSGEQDDTTLAVTDLSKVEKVSEELDAVAGQMRESLGDVETFGKISKRISKAENYGGNTPSEGYTNMVDLGDMAEKISKNMDTAKLTKALDEAVIYQVKGKNKSKGHGLSLYYPLNCTQATDIETMEKISASKNYTKFIKGLVYGQTTGSSADYTDDAQVEPEESEELASEDQVQINLSEELALNEDNYYCFNIDPESIPNVGMVNYNLYMDSGDGENYLYLGLDDNVAYDQESGYVEDAFEGVWPCLNGQGFLTMYVVEQTEEHTIFSAPIYLNDEETNLRFMYSLEDESWTVLGVWDGLDENGQAARAGKTIEEGDVIAPNYVAVNASTGETENVKGDDIKIKDRLEITEEDLPRGDYIYNFSIDDIYGSTMYLDYVSFKVLKDGTIEPQDIY